MQQKTEHDHNDQVTQSCRSILLSFRLSTGHDCLAKHFHRIGILQLPYFALCKEHEDMDRTHIMKCSVLRRSTEHERYREARELMSVYN